MVEESLLQSFNKSFIELAAALAILLLGLVLGRFFGKLIHHLLRQVEIDKLLKKSKINIPLEELVNSIVKYAIYVIAAVLALHQLGLATRILYSIILILIIFLLAFIVLAIKDFIPNLIAGIIILRRKQLKKGDTIQIGNMSGKIVDITITEIKIKAENQDILFIPNAFFHKHIMRKKAS